MSAALLMSQNSPLHVGPAKHTWAIFLVSLLALFMELMLIRWISTEIRIFAYLQNTVLVVCFLGLGMGCFTCQKPFVLRDLLLPLLLLVTLLAIPATRKLLGQISDMLAVLGDLVIWYQTFTTTGWRAMGSLLIGLLLTLGVMVLLWDIFVPLGRLLGRLLDEHPQTIWAYSVNVVGSLVGVWFFVALSRLYQPPIVWFAVVGVLLLCFLERRGHQWRIDLVLLCAVVGLSWFAGREAGSTAVIWSPYQKLALRDAAANGGGIGRYVIQVNNVGYQALIDLSEMATATDTQRYPPDMR